MNLEPAESAACPHDACEGRFRDLGRRLELLEDDWRSMGDALSDIREKLAELKGRMAGYLVAASLLGTAVAFLAAYVLRGA